MKILYPVAYFHPENIAFSHIEKALLRAFVQNGHDVFVICPTPTRGISDDIYQKYKRIKDETIMDGRVHIHRFWCPREKQNTLSRAIRYVWLVLREYWMVGRVGKNDKCDVALLASTPPILGLIAERIKNAHNCRVVYMLQDIFPDSLLNTGIVRKKGLLWKIGRRIEDSVYMSSDRTIAISDDFKKNIMAKGVSADKISVIPNWADTDSIHYVERSDNPLFDKYGLDRSKFYIAYSGNIGLTQNMDMLLNAAYKLLDRTDIGFILVGDGAYRETVERRIQDEKLKNVHLLPFQPYEDIANVFSLGDVGLIISKPGVGSNSVPSKAWGYMAAERSLLASFDSQSEMCSIIREQKCGTCVDADDETGLRLVIISLYEQRNTLKECGERGRKYVDLNLSKDVCLGKYIGIIDEQVTESRSYNERFMARS